MTTSRMAALAAALFIAFALMGGLAAVSRAHASEVIATSGDKIGLDMSKGTLIRLDRPAATVFVANPDIADVQIKSPRLVYLTAKQPGETVVYAVDKDERIILSRTVSVSHNLSRLRSALKSLLPGTNIGVESVDNTLVLHGRVNSAKDAEDARVLVMRQVAKDKDLVNKLSVVAPNQIHLRVRVTEIQRDVLKRFGINWNAVFQTGSFLFGIATAFPAAAQGATAITGAFRNSKVDLNGVIDALDDEGMIKVLAEPNLTAVSGESATFLAGGEFPILVPDDGKVTVEFKEFGVSLAFTPVLIGNRISLKVKPEVSALSTDGAVEINGFTIPALTTRRAETTVELGSGQSFAIAGLLQNNITRSVDKVPGLGEVPVLGSLFRSDEFRRNETELVIIVTPYIVRPVEPGKLLAATDGFKPPSDTDRILHGRTHQPHLERNRRAVHGRGARSGLAGPAGFITE